MNADELLKEERYKEAFKSYTLALKATPPEEAIPIRLKIVDCLSKMRQYTRARDELLQFRDSPVLRRKPLLYAEFLILLAEVNVNLGNCEEARLGGEEAFEILRQTDENRFIARVQRILGIVFFSQGESEKARTWFEDLLSTCRRTGDEHDTLFPLNGLAQVHFCAGRWPQALECLERGLKVSSKLGNERWNSTFMLNLGTVYRKSGDWIAARKYLESSTRIGRNLMDTLHVLRGRLSLAFLYRVQRHWKRASRLLNSCRRVSEKEGYKRELCLSYEGLGTLALDQGNCAEAQQHYDKAYEIAVEIAPEGDLAIELTRCLAELYLALDEPEKSSHYAASAAQMAKRFGDQFEEACAYRVHALAYQKLNLLQKVEQSFTQALQLFQELGEKYERGRTLLQFGGFLQSTNDLDEAVHCFLQAEPLFKALPSEYWIAVTQLELARARFSQDDLDAAVSYVDRAQALFEKIDEKEAMNEVSLLREIVEAKMIESALHTVSHYSAPEGNLDELIDYLANEIRAERAFLVLCSDGDFEVKSLLNIEEEEARELFSSLATPRLKKPLISTNLHLNKKFAHLQRNGALAFMLLPFGASANRGALYVDKRGPFSQRDLVSSVHFTDSLVLKIAEIQQRELKEENLRLLREIQKKGYPEIVTQSRKMLDILDMVEKIKDDSAPVLIQGETGAGKELIARALHYKGRRRSKPFVPLDCGTPTETLAESEFFGHKKGSFTDAKEDKPGLFEQANGGTLFLDEVANLSEDVQAKLLRVLQDGKVRRIGETRERKVSVRVIAATNKDLEREVVEGRFRKDLFFRLKGIRIQLPPLREHKEDIPLLVHHFVAKFSKEKKRKVEEITESAMRALTDYCWDGNVRELESEIERAILLMEDGRVTPELFSSSIRKTSSRRGGSYNLHDLIRALDENGWVKRRAARALGIPESTLRKRLKTHGISSPSGVRSSGAHN